jgi:hypothetical protein
MTPLYLCCQLLEVVAVAEHPLVVVVFLPKEVGHPQVELQELERPQVGHPQVGHPQVGHPQVEVRLQVEHPQVEVLPQEFQLVRAHHLVHLRVQVHLQVRVRH